MENLREINCKEIFKKAYENRYTWNNEFNGYKGKCIFFLNNNVHEGEFLLGKDFKPCIEKIQRISKPGLRVYSNAKKMPRILGGFGKAIVSTSRGLMTDHQARKEGIGGELLFYIW